MHLEFFSQETRKTIREYKSTLLYIQVEGISSIVLYPISNFSTVVLAVICNIKKIFLLNITSKLISSMSTVFCML